MGALTVRICTALSDVDPARWDALVGDESPFLEWGWLASLEDAGCVARQTGWLPQHLTLWRGSRLVGACPLYVKGHSQGEFVFDHAWAEAAGRAGLTYYPKLLVAVPFTPAAGPRLLVAASADADTVRRQLAGVLKDVCTASGFSSVHVNFCRPDESDLLAGAGFLHRLGYQFQWQNPGWQTFDEYLGAFRSKRRVQIKRERRELDAQGITITAHTGAEIGDELFDPMFRLYRTTIDKLFWGRPYLNRAFFALLRERWKHRLCFFAARRGDTLVAGAITVRKGETLYGRYWGTFEECRHLHFNVCYYAPIEYCLREGLSRFEPGAGGEFKQLRGFDARPTHSMHFVADPGFAAAVRRYLATERAATRAEIEALQRQSALKPPATGA